jgi:tetratricopeptide (TPR) repeat protein
VLAAWQGVADSTRADAARRFSVQIDATPLAGADQAEQQQAKEAATALLALPWELLHDGRAFLFQGARAVRVRRRLPSTKGYHRPLLDPPIRILLVSPRPEDDACGYIDHRVSALPLTDAVEHLGGLVDLDILRPPTLPALRQALTRAREHGRPYHVIHFDGHGVYDRHKGLGGLCFEDPNDLARLDRRRHRTVYTDDLGPLLQDHRIPLVFLEACQTALAEDATESVATELLQAGVAGVVAMTHSVLVTTAAKFVRPFYAALAAGGRIGDAMLAGQQTLKDDPARGQVFGAGELTLQDWFVPVLYQEQDDPRLFAETPAPRTVEAIRTDLARRLGELPEAPPTGFIGRSRELLALERLLQTERWALIRGQGGEGKTALACELARWRIRTGESRRIAFVCVEHSVDPKSVLDALGRQLCPDYSVATFQDLARARQPVERALREQPTLLVLDNLEALLPRSLDPEAPPTLVAETAEQLAAILALARDLLPIGDTRLLLTSREPLDGIGPALFQHPDHRRELHRLADADALRLIEKALGQAGAARPDAETEAMLQLIEAVQGHARTLALLAPSLRAQGVDATRRQLVALMEQMEREHPNDRERSLYASVALSLARLSPEHRERARVLGVFHGGVDLDMLRAMMAPEKQGWLRRLLRGKRHATGITWHAEDIEDLATQLIATGLATAGPYNHLALNPALCPYLRRDLNADERAALDARWQQAMGAYVDFLEQQFSQDTELAATLTRLELPNLLALLARREAAGDPAAVIDLTTALHRLTQFLGRAQLHLRLAQARDTAEQALTAQGDGLGLGHAAFEARRTRIQQQLAAGQLQAAFDGARALLDEARQAGPAAYPDADYDLAVAHFLLARVLTTAGNPDPALDLLAQARQGFENVAREQPGRGAERMASACLTERGDCLHALGRLDEAAAAYEEGIRGAERRGAERDVAVGKGQLGTVRLLQGRTDEALAAYAEARVRFEALGEPGTVAAFWHQTGVAEQAAGRGEAAEDAYRQALAIAVRLGDRAGQASTLGQLGLLYNNVLDRPEEAAAFYRQAVDRYVELGDRAKEGLVRNNLADTLCRLGRLDEARREVRGALACRAEFGHAAEPWTTWDTLADIETAAADAPAAAAARAEALGAYLAYRRAGGENHSSSGRLALALAEPLLAGDPAAAEALLDQVAAELDAADGGSAQAAATLRPFLAPLRAICRGSRDPALADASDLHYSMAAEIRLLLERLT